LQSGQQSPRLKKDFDQIALTPEQFTLAGRKTLSVSLHLRKPGHSAQNPLMSDMGIFVRRDKPA
jgi:hypothetical protein